MAHALIWVGVVDQDGDMTPAGRLDALAYPVTAAGLKALTRLWCVMDLPPGGLCWRIYEP